MQEEKLEVKKVEETKPEPFNREVDGNIFEFWNSSTPIVIPINLNLNKYGHNVMEKGVAKDAKELFPILPNMIGASIKKYRNKAITVFTYVLETNRVVEKQKETAVIFALPTKKNYWESSDIELVRSMVKILKAKVDFIQKKVHIERVMIPKIGCGEGGLDWETQVKQILVENLDDRFVLVNYKQDIDEDCYK